jgi:predicted XRE-type DNA-binding protein
MDGTYYKQELFCGSGNIFSDLGLPNANKEHLRAVLAAEIGKALTAEGWGVREAARKTGVAAADFSRIRNANLERFTIDRLLTILDRLHREVTVNVAVDRRNPCAPPLR